MLVLPPVTTYNFDVEFIGRRRIYRASFAFCSGLKVQANVVNIPEGGKNDRPHTHVKGITYQPIVLERGMTKEMDLISFFSNQFDPALGLTHHYRGMREGNLFTMKIKKKDRAGNVLRTVELRKCQVIAYEEGDNSAMQSGIMIESITVDFDEAFVS